MAADSGSPEDFRREVRCVPPQRKEWNRRVARNMDQQTGSGKLSVQTILWPDLWKLQNCFVFGQLAVHSMNPQSPPQLASLGCRMEGSAVVVEDVLRLNSQLEPR